MGSSYTVVALVNLLTRPLCTPPQHRVLILHSFIFSLLAVEAVRKGRFRVLFRQVHAHDRFLGDKPRRDGGRPPMLRTQCVVPLRAENYGCQKCVVDHISFTKSQPIV